MKRLLIILFITSLYTAAFSQENNCMVKGIELKGTVRVVEANADLIVCIKPSQTLNSREITLIPFIPSRCGEWYITDGASDFTIQITEYESAADMVITLYPNDQREPFIEKYKNLIHL